MFTIHTKPLLFKAAIFVVLSGILLSAGWFSPAEAGNWRVAPIKLAFDVKSRSEVVTVINVGDQPLALEVTAVEWTQDQEGQDVYQPATDLVFFPKQLVIEPNKERVIRTGIKVPAVDREKTYRLFIKEIPDRRQVAENTVVIAIQFGVPIFVTPIQVNTAGAITDVQLVDGILSAKIENQGNSHLRISTIMLHGESAAGERLFTQESNGWYLLNGTSRTFTSSPIPEEICKKLSVLDIKINADQININRRVDVDQTMCSAP